jgi:hypothetical protein
VTLNRQTREGQAGPAVGFTETQARINVTKEVLKDAAVVVIEGGSHLGTPPRPEFHRAPLDFLKASPARVAT